ncbi:DNA methyltransferase [Amycolatopsis sp. MEPSY49]|uniref:DNA methyltransferase n=1 Tax=Amycolatopsis sp. MEPSY49 TaxID=3151600 RepID=UPI003EF513AD
MVRSWRNQLFYGDNLDVLRRHVPDESVDLIYLDPPFNSNRSYNVLFKHKSGDESQAQIEAFDDTWVWSQDSESQYHEIINGGAPVRVADTLEAMRRLVGENDVLAYLVMMTVRLVELHRVLKLSGSLYLHCDPTASHYLKIILDAIFGPELFRNEIVWRRTMAKGLMSRRLPSNHDTILVYSKSELPTWVEEAVFQPYDQLNLDERTAQKYSQRDSDGRLYQLTSLINPSQDRPNLTYEFLGVTRVWRWTKQRMQEAYESGLVVQTKPGRVPRLKRYLDEQRGKPLDDVWSDIPPLNSRAAERLGYPTQKPVSLLERIIKMASKEGDVVLDPFCGCGTAIAAAERLDRRWMGIDVTYLAVDLIEKRLRHTYGESVMDKFTVVGIPRDVEAAQALFARSPFEFERWAVSLVDGQPNEKQVGDKGIDGVIRFIADSRGSTEKVLVSVKGGRQLGPQMVRDLAGTVSTNHAAGGVLITLAKPTRGMIDASRHSGLFHHARQGKAYPRVQLISVPELLEGKRPTLPPVVLPYVQAKRNSNAGVQQTIF